MGFDLVGRTLLAGQTVFEHKAGDAVVRQPFGDRVAFTADIEDVVAAARADDDGGAGCLFLGRQVDGDAGIVDVVDLGFQVALFLDEFLFVFFFFKTRRALGPEVHYLGRNALSGKGD